MPNDNDCFQFRIIAQIINWVLIIGGWLIVDRQNNHREKRKEIRAALNQLLQDLDTLEQQAYSYHKAQKTSTEAGRDIRLALDRISRSIGRQNLLPSGNKFIRKLRQAITLNNFDTESFIPQSTDSELLAGISATKDDLVDALERHFKTQYHN